MRKLAFGASLLAAAMYAFAAASNPASCLMRTRKLVISQNRFRERSAPPPVLRSARPIAWIPVVPVRY